jgi:hypothetical protein
VTLLGGPYLHGRQGRWALPSPLQLPLTHIMSRAQSGRSATVSLKTLVGSGDRIGLFTLPFLVVGLILNVAYPSVFDVGGPPTALRGVSVAVLAAGVAIWAWSVWLIVTRVPRGELITRGPYALV